MIFPRLPVEHIRQGGLAAVKDPVQVDSQHPPPAFGSDVGEELLPGNAGVAHQHVNAAKVPEEGGQHPSTCACWETSQGYSPTGTPMASSSPARVRAFSWEV